MRCGAALAVLPRRECPNDSAHDGLAFATNAGCRSSGLLGASDGGPGDASTSDGAPPTNVHIPINHRPSDAQCATTASPGDCSFNNLGDPSMCSSDSMCTTGTNPRCVVLQGGIPDCQCTSDTCQHDTDCPMGQLCACHGSAFLATGNTCYPGNCRIDGDCGTNGYCSPSAGTTGCGGLVGYYCHTADDTCTDDNDCNAALGVLCEFTTNHWSCQNANFCA
jgi:hypothetical protein